MAQGVHCSNFLGCNGKLLMNPPSELTFFWQQLMFIDFKPLSSHIHNLSYLQIIKIGLRIFALKLGKSTTELVSSPHYEPDHRARVACGVDLGWYCAQQSACTQGDSFEGPGWKNVGNNKEKTTLDVLISNFQWAIFSFSIIPCASVDPCKQPWMIVGGAPRSPLDKWRCWCRPTWSHLSLNWTPPSNQLMSMVTYENCLLNSSYR